MNFVNPVEEFAKAGEAVDRRWEAQQEDQAFQQLSQLAQDPQYKGQPISQFLEAAGAKALESGSAKFGLKLMNQASLAQTREAAAAENQIQAEERQLDTMQSTVVGLKAIKDPVERATASVDALKALGSRTPPQQRPMIDKAIADIQQNPQKADGYLNYFETAFKTSKARLSEQNLLLKGAQIEAQILKAENDALRNTRKDARDQVGFLVDYDQPVPKSLARAAGLGGAADQEPLSVRNNNPGNLRDPKTGEFKQFATPEEGRKALTADLAGKLEGTSPAYKAKFGDAPITPERLAEVWSPASAAGNTAESTRNYGKAIADALGIKVGEKIANTPENREKIANAITAFESGQTKDTIKLTKQPKSVGGLVQERAYNIIENFGQATKELMNVANAPADSVLGSFAGLTGKSGDSLTAGLTGALARGVLTSDDQRSMEIMIAGLEAAMANVLGGGYASSASMGRMKQYEKQIPRAGDSPEQMALFLARIKQELHTAGENYGTRPGVNESQREQMKSYLTMLDQTIPWSVEDVNRVKVQKSGKGTVQESVSKPYTQTEGNTVTLANGTTYKRPANFTDAQWNSYKQSVGR